MSFPSGPSGAQGGYPNQPPQPSPGYGPPATRRPNSLASLPMSHLLGLAVTALALISYFCSYTGDAANVNTQVLILLTGGLLAGMHVLPRGPKTLPFGALLSVVGGLSVLASVIQFSGGSMPTIVIVILIISLLQLLAAVGALLLDHEIIKLAPKQANVHYGPPAGGYQSPQQQQATTTFAPGGQQPNQQPGPQSTRYMQQPGQISQPPPGNS